jgi:hypothetical protein
MKIYSKVDSALALASYISLDEIDSKRESLNSNSEPLQIGAIRWPLGSLAPPHRPYNFAEVRRRP